MGRPLRRVDQPQARRVVRDHDFGDAFAEVAITHGGSPILRRCLIHDGKQSGLVASEGGWGTVEDCDIYANTMMGVEISVYSHKSAVFEEVTQRRGSFARTLQGAKLLRERNITVTIKTPIPSSANTRVGRAAVSGSCPSYR